MLLKSFERFSGMSGKPSTDVVQMVINLEVKREGFKGNKLVVFIEHCTSNIIYEWKWRDVHIPKMSIFIFRGKYLFLII